jgi:hypothetical protein
VRLLLLTTLLLCGCINVQWQRDHRFEQPERQAYLSLEPGVHDLDDCLERFGAPLLAWEEPGGAALAWGWFEGDERGFGVSLPVSDSYSASFRGSALTGDMKGLVLLFDESWNVRLVRRGRLRELLTYAKKRPTFVDDGGE